MELARQVQYGVHSLRLSISALRKALVEACQALPWAAAVSPAGVAQHLRIILQLHEALQAASRAAPARRDASPELDASRGTPSGGGAAEEGPGARAGTSAVAIRAAESGGVGGAKADAATGPIRSAARHAPLLCIEEGLQASGSGESNASAAEAGTACDTGRERVKRECDVVPVKGNGKPPIVPAKGKGKPAGKRPRKQGKQPVEAANDGCGTGAFSGSGSGSPKPSGATRQSAKRTRTQSA